MADCFLRILCIGNPLHGNDAVGHAVFKHLSSVKLPEGADLIDGGTGGLTLLPMFRDVPRVLVVDVADTGDAVGTIKIFKAIEQGLPTGVVSGAEHGGDLTTLMAMLPIYVNKLPDVDLICVSAKGVIHFKPEMQPQIERVIAEVCDQIKHYVDSHSCISVSE